MPTYEYRCPNGHDFEHFFRKISEATSEMVCPVCGATAVRRVSGGAGLLFKGSGFYLTDYGKNAHRRGGSESSSSDGGGDSKPASTPDGGKTDNTARSATKAEGGASSTSKTDSNKTSESKPSSTPKGGDAK